MRLTNSPVIFSTRLALLLKCLSYIDCLPVSQHYTAYRRLSKYCIQRVNKSASKFLKETVLNCVRPKIFAYLPVYSSFIIKARLLTIAAKHHIADMTASPLVRDACTSYSRDMFRLNSTAHLHASIYQLHR